MMFEPNNMVATKAEIDTFRTALAVTTAMYRQDKKAYKIACQLITDPNDFVSAIQAISQLLLKFIDETDGEYNAEQVLDGFRSAAACAIPTD
jgi:hypothetical protein